MFGVSRDYDKIMNIGRILLDLKQKYFMGDEFLNVGGLEEGAVAEVVAEEVPAEVAEEVAEEEVADETVG